MRCPHCLDHRKITVVTVTIDPETDEAYFARASPVTDLHGLGSMVLAAQCGKCGARGPFAMRSEDAKVLFFENGMKEAV